MRRIAPQRRAQVFTVGGDIADTRTFIAQLDKAVPGARELITCSGGALPVASKLDDTELRRAYPGLLRIPLAQGIRETAEVFRFTTETQRTQRKGG